MYNCTYSKKHRNIFAIKSASRPDRPILCVKPAIVDITFRDRTERRGAQLWFIGTDTIKIVWPAAGSAAMAQAPCISRRT
jgi:hypothetical protein